jgi:hypothetical protein
MGEEAGIAALSRLQRKYVVADHALEPFDPIVAGDAKFASM